MIGRFVIVRTKTAGVHCGTITQQAGTAALLSDARRIWRWDGAFSLHEMAMDGCAESSRISKPVPEILLTEAIEVIPCSSKGEANLRRSRNGA